MAWYSDDVIWNWGAARDASNALQRAADLLENTANERERKAREATAEWRGEYREDFDSKLRVILQKARSLASEYRNTARTFFLIKISITINTVIRRADWISIGTAKDMNQ